MGAGILPVCKVNGIILFLFGKEGQARGNQWSDFGGSRDGRETPYQTACREGAEELNGFLGNKREMGALIRNHQFDKIVVDKYTTYLVEIPHEPLLPYYFESNYKLMQDKFPELIGKNGMFEKSKIKWFTINDIRRSKKQFRPFYRKTIDEILSRNYK